MLGQQELAPDPDLLFSLLLRESNAVLVAAGYVFDIKVLNTGYNHWLLKIVLLLGATEELVVAPVVESTRLRQAQ